MTNSPDDVCQAAKEQQCTITCSIIKLAPCYDGINKQLLNCSKLGLPRRITLNYVLHSNNYDCPTVTSTGLLGKPTNSTASLHPQGCMSLPSLPCLISGLTFAESSNLGYQASQNSHHMKSTRPRRTKPTHFCFPYHSMFRPFGWKTCRKSGLDG